MKIPAVKLIISLLAVNCIVQFAITREPIHIAISLLLIVVIAFLVRACRRYESSK